MKNFLNQLVNIFYPKSCLACRKPLDNNAIDNLICPACWQAIKKNTPPLCTICGRQIRGKQVSETVCADCQKQRFSFDRALSPCIYEGVLRELIHKFKYQNKDYLSPLLSRLLVEFIDQSRIRLDYFDLVMPIPLDKIKLREREFNQAELIARQLADKFSLRLSLANLWRKNSRQAQAELKTDKRWENIKDCFALRNPQEVKEKNVFLIDDVLTTGATCSEASSMLKKAGADSVFVLTLAN